MKIAWLFEAQNEYRDQLSYYKTKVGSKYATVFARKILSAVRQLQTFPEIGVLRQDTLMGKYGFRAIFIDYYACIYKIENDEIYIFYLTDARKNCIYNIFGIE